MAADDYHHSQRTRFTLAELQREIGNRGRMVLEGEIIDAGESPAGAYVKFKIDERYGLEQDIYVCDFDLLDATWPR